MRKRSGQTIRANIGANGIHKPLYDPAQAKIAREMEAQLHEQDERARNAQVLWRSCAGKGKTAA